MPRIPARQLVTSASTPAALGVTGAAGGGDAVAFATHSHAHGAQSDPTMHALASGSAHGFFQSSDFTKLAGIAAGADVTLTTLAAATSDIAVNSRKLILLADPVSAQDAATKAYVDAVATGLDCKPSVRAVAVSAVTLSGLQTVDGVSLANNDRVLVAAGGSATNGIYRVNSGGAWTRATDAASSAQVTGGMFTFVTEGTNYADTGWVLTTNDTIVLDATALQFTQFSSAGILVNGNGLAKSGNTWSVQAADASIAVSGSGVSVGVLQNDAQHGNRGGGTTHSLVNSSTSGFVAGTDFYALLSTRQACKYATTAAITSLAGGAPSAVDGSGTLGGGERILVKDQANSIENGIYRVSTVGAGSNGTWVRDTDASSAGQMSQGTAVRVLLGTVNAGTIWAITSPLSNTITPGSSSITWSLMAGPASATPNAVAATGSAGASKKPSASDHTHAHGSQTDGTMHAAASGSAAGFQSATHYTRVETLQPGVVSQLGYVQAQSLFSYTNSLTWSSTLSLNVLGANDFRVVLGGNTAFTFTNANDGYSGTIYVKQDGTGGRTASFSASGWTVIKDSGLTDLQPQSAANSLTMYAYSCVVIGGTSYIHMAKSLLA